MDQVGETMAHLGENIDDIRAQVNKTWHVLVSQFGYWNTQKIAALDAVEYFTLPKEVKEGVLIEFSKYVDEVVCVFYYINLVIFAPKVTTESEDFAMLFPGATQIPVNHDLQIQTNSLSTLERAPRNSTPLQAPIPTTDKIPENSLIARYLGEDFLTQHPIDEAEHGGSGRGPRRPPNAFILYRKDKASQIKDAYPNIHNNEISVMVGALWHNEIEEVRQAYVMAATLLKRRFLEMHPGYRYNPRRPSEIQRRTRSQPVMARVSKNGVSRISLTNSRRRGLVQTLIQTSTAEDISVPHTLPMNVQNAITTRFPGARIVHQGPIETTVMQDLPYLAEPLTTVISNENLQAVVAAHDMHHTSTLPSYEDIIGSPSDTNTPNTFGIETQQPELLEHVWEFPQTGMEDFVDFNAGH